MLALCLGVSYPLAARQQRVRDIEQKREPDAGESRGFGGTEGLAINEDAEDEGGRGRGELQQADGGERQLARRRGEPDQRQGGDNAGTEQQRVPRWRGKPERALPGRRKPNQIGPGDRRQDGRLEGEADER